MTQQISHRPSAERAIACPRCGYDQRGVIETWKNACPLEGTCSECGLTLDWHELFHPERFLPVWCVEHVVQRRRFPRAAFATLLRSCWPWLFWKRLKMAHMIRLWRIIAYLLMLLMPLPVLYVVAQAAVALAVVQRANAHLQQSQRSLPALMQQAQSGQLMPLGFPGTALPSFALAAEVQLQERRQQMIDSVQFQMQYPPRLDFTPMQAMLEAIFTPMAQQSRGTIVVFTPSADMNTPGAVNAAPLQTTAPYVAPRDLWRTYFDPTASPIGMAFGGGTWFGARTGLFDEIQPTLDALAFWMMTLAIGLPLSMVLLPVSRRRARVRWAHIGRVFLYSVAIPLLLLQVTVAAWLCAALLWPTQRIDDEVWMLPMLLVMPLMLVCWWWAAIKHYLRLPHALPVTVILAVLCVLVAAAVMFWGSRLIA